MPREEIAEVWTMRPFHSGCYRAAELSKQEVIESWRKQSRTERGMFPKAKNLNGREAPLKLFPDALKDGIDSM